MCRFWGMILEVETGAALPKNESMKRLLIIDDDDDLRIRCVNELSKEGYLVYSVSSGPEGLDFLGHDPRINLIILDVKMAPMDGKEVLEELHKRNVTVPVVVYSGHADYKDNFEALPADAIILKNTDLSELKTKIKELLSSRSDHLVA